MRSIRRFLANVLKNIGLLGVIGLLLFGVLEGLSRLVYPVQYGHKSYAMDGVTPIYPAADMTGVMPSLSYRQRAAEFDAITTHTARGFRGPAGGFMDAANPSELFLGDSMTYGIGLSDEQTIPYLYCAAKNVTCANLGRPGTGTGDAVAILTRRLNEGLRPARVNLVMNVMTAAQFAGNDITDDLTAAQASADIATQNADAYGAVLEEKPAPRALISHADILEHSNLARLTYHVFAPMLRQMLARDFTDAQLHDALAITRGHLVAINDLAQENKFEFVIYIVHPMQDLTRGTWEKTGSDIAAMAPVRVIDTAPALLDGGDPVQYYFPLDGHIRPDGAAKIAEFMVKNN